jgi:hypothetical protein
MQTRKAREPLDDQRDKNIINTLFVNADARHSSANITSLLARRVPPSNDSPRPEIGIATAAKQSRWMSVPSVPFRMPM